PRRLLEGPAGAGGILLRPLGGAGISLGACRAHRLRRIPPPSPPRMARRRSRCIAAGHSTCAIPLVRIRCALVHSLWPSGEPGLRQRHRARIPRSLAAHLRTHQGLALLALARALLLGALDRSRPGRAVPPAAPCSWPDLLRRGR